MCRPRGAQFHNAAYPALKGGAIIFRASGARFSDFLPPLPKRTIGSHTPSEALGYDMSRLRRLIFARSYSTGKDENLVLTRTSEAPGYSVPAPQAGLDCWLSTLIGRPRAC